MTDDATSRFEAAVGEPPRDRYRLRLFVAGAAPTSVRALQRTREVCERHLAGRYELEVIDVHQRPERASEDDIFAIPTLLKELPAPLRRVIGELSDEGRVLIALGIETKR